MSCLARWKLRKPFVGTRCSLHIQAVWSHHRAVHLSAHCGRASDTYTPLTQRIQTGLIPQRITWNIQLEMESLRTYVIVVTVNERLVAL